MAMSAFIGHPRTDGAARSASAKIALSWRPALSLSVGGVGGSFALTRASSPSGCICHLGPTPSLAGKPIDWPIDHNAKRRVIARCPARSRYAESSVPMAGSAITLQSPRACTGALLNAPWKELTERRASSTGTGGRQSATPICAATAESALLKVEQAQPEQSSFYRDD